MMTYSVFLVAGLVAFILCAVVANTSHPAQSREEG